MTQQRYAIGVDLGGTKIVGGLVDGSGRQIVTRRCPTPVAAGPDGVFAAMQEMLRELLALAGERPVLGIGLGIPGLLDPAAGVSLFSPNLGWRQVPVLEAFREFGLPVWMENDVRCHAVGEWHFGAGRGVAHSVLITLGTGIGSGMIVDGRLFSGPGGVAGEIGHLTLQPDGPLCGCGKRGCFEALASGRAIGRRAQEAGIAGTAQELFALVAAGDARALELVDRVAYDLGRGISMYINLMNPQRVIIGGGVATAGELLFAPLRRYAEQETMSGIRGTYEIVPAMLGEEAGLVGAAALVPGLSAQEGCA